MPVFLAASVHFVNFSSSFPSDQWLRLAGGSQDVFFVLQTSFPFHFSVSLQRALDLAPALWYRRSRPSLRGQSSSLSSVCALGTFPLCPLPKLAAEKIGSSPVRWSLAAVPNNYLCFRNFFSAPETSYPVFFLHLYNICIFSSLLSFLPPIPPPAISFFNVP